MGKKLIVIGGGIAGLSSAALLAKKGFEVTLLEKNNAVGGRMSLWRSKGFTFDTGPSWYLMPEVMERLYFELGYETSDFFKLKKLNPSYRAFFSEKHYDVEPDIKKTKTLFDSFEKNGSEKFDKYIKKSKALYEMAMQNYMYVNNYNLLNFINLRTLKNAVSFPFFQNMESYVGRKFSSQEARNILTYNLVFLGGTPANTPALYMLMAHVDFNLGVYYPMGGMYELVKALRKVCSKHGARVVTGCQVNGVAVSSGKIESVKTSKGNFSADVVVNTSDYWHFDTKILPADYRGYNPAYWKNKAVAPSAFVVCLGVKKKIKNLRHHNIFFNGSPKGHYDQIFKTPAWPKEPSFYVCAASKSDPAVAPKGAENLFILVPVAAGLKDTTHIRKNYYNKVIGLLEKYTGEKVREYIVTKKIITIKDYENDYNAFRGTAFGLAHTLTQTSFLRPSIKNSKIDNLYYAGQYVHPGIGVPSVIISAHIAANEIASKFK